jgi:hypothetical protein
LPPELAGRIDAEGAQVDAVASMVWISFGSPVFSSIANTATLFSPPLKTFLPSTSTSPWLRLVT